MEDGSAYVDAHMKNVLVKSERISCTSEVLDSLWVSNSSSPSFLGSTSMVKFEEIRDENNTEMQFFTKIDNKSENGNEDFEGSFHQPEKKRRLLPDQVQFLEKNFDLENKLEPDRKVQLAKELGLQPRQVAIWFQNRRARYKTKLLEKEYDSFKASYDKLQEDYDTLCKLNETLKNEVHLLKEKFPKMEPFDPVSPLDLQPKKPILPPNSASNVAPVMACKQEDAASSVKSDILDSDSPYYTDGNHSMFLEPTDSSHVFEPDPSDFSQDEDDNLSRSLLPLTCLPKLEIECYDDLQPISCNLGFPVQDQGPWFW